jgi:hypothetical protein
MATVPPKARTPSKDRKDRKEQSLGMEHELAPAYQNDDGWNLIDVYAFNKAKTVAAVGWNRVDTGIVVALPGWSQPAGRATPVPKDAYSPLRSGQLTFIEGSRLYDGEGWFVGQDVKGHAKQHAKGCASLVEIVGRRAATYKWTGVDVELRVHPYWTEVTARPGPVSLEDFEKALRKATAPLFREADSNSRRNAFELDSGFVEVKSAKFRNATIDSIASELRTREAAVLKRSRELAPAGTRVALLPRAQVVQDGTETYAGSFHVWITLPHVPGPSFDHAAFVRDHSRLVASMQHLEPLLLACMPMDPRAPGSGDEFSRASMRSRMNGLSGFATATMPVSPKARKVMCYASLESLNAGDDPVVVTTAEILETTKAGAEINVLACSEQSRGTELDHDWNSGTGARYQNTGTDFRFNTCWSCVNRWGDDKPAYYKDAKGRIRTAQKTIKSGKWVPRKSCAPNMTGVEFRVFDHLMIPHEDLLGIVVIAAAAGKATENPSSDPCWMTQMLRCARYGSRTPVSSGYWAALCKAFGVKASDAPKDAFTALNRILSEAFAAASKTTIARKFGLKAAPTFPDVNFEVWTKTVNEKKAHDSTLAAKIARVAKKPDTLVKELGEGWIPDRYAIAATF